MQLRKEGRIQKLQLGYQYRENGDSFSFYNEGRDTY